MAAAAKIGDESVGDWVAGLVAAASAAAQASGGLPDPAQFRALSALPQFRASAGPLFARVLSQTQRLLARASPAAAELLSEPAAAAAAAPASAAAFAAGADVCDRFDEVFMGAFDDLLDAVDTFADEASGARATQRMVLASSGGGGAAVLYARNVVRPQATFGEPVDNFPHGPWVPRITRKPNAVVSLEQVFADFRAAQQQQEEEQQKQQSSSETPTTASAADIGAHLATLGVHRRGKDEAEQLRFPNPYEAELKRLEYASWQLEPAPEQRFGDLESTPLTWVETPEQLRAMAQKLAETQEFAVDLEAHDYRSFQGFVCLMQVSTRSEDFVVDTLKLRRHMQQHLQPVFTDPRILKVFHGSDWDILWLQRDFGLYIVNLFDTGQAARVLEFPGLGLKYLLKLYCDVDVDKRYQLADWRIRPLPAEMLQYARGDTHYLLYIYDRLKTELLARARGDADLLLSVLHRSRGLCLRTYSPPPIPGDAQHQKLLASSSAPLTPGQVAASRELMIWRDHLAREEDESERYIMPNSLLLKICEEMPRDTPSLLNICKVVPPLIRVHAAEILDIIKKHLPPSSGEKAATVFDVLAREKAARQKKAEGPKHTRFAEDGTAIASQPARSKSPQSRATEKPPTPIPAAATAAAAEPIQDVEMEVADDEVQAPPRLREATSEVIVTSGSLFSAATMEDSDDDEDDEGKAAAQRIAASMSFMPASLPTIAPVPAPASPGNKAAKPEQKEEDEGVEEEEEDEDEEEEEPPELAEPPQKKKVAASQLQPQPIDLTADSESESDDEVVVVERPVHKPQPPQPRAKQSKRPVPFNFKSMAAPSAALSLTQQPPKQQQEQKPKTKKGRRQIEQLAHVPVQQPRFARSGPRTSKFQQAPASQTFSGPRKR